MTHGNMVNGGSSDLPEEMLAVLPSDPFEQLGIAQKITAVAISSRLSRLEADVNGFKQKLSDKDQLIFSLQEQVRELENALQDASSRLSQALDEQAKLTNEKNALAASAKKLARDVSKLETFKRALMQSLQEDDDNSAQAGNIDMLNASQTASLGSSLCSTNSLGKVDTFSTPKSQLDEEPGSTKVTLKYFPAHGDDDNHGETDGSKAGFIHSFSLTPPRLTPQLTPTGSPKQSGASSPQQKSPISGRSGSGSPRQHSTGEFRMSFYSSQPTSKRTTAPSSPRHGSIPCEVFYTSRTPRVDGKEFFRQARNKLSYQQFSAFLANIKELNAHRQTREEMLRKADDIFGAENKDLYQSFSSLLSHHLPAQT